MAVDLLASDRLVIDTAVALSSVITVIFINTLAVKTGVNLYFEFDLSSVKM